MLLYPKLGKISMFGEISFHLIFFVDFRCYLKSVNRHIFGDNNCHICQGKVPKVGNGMLDFEEDIFVGVKSH